MCGLLSVRPDLHSSSDRQKQHRLDWPGRVYTQGARWATWALFTAGSSLKGAGLAASRRGLSCNWLVCSELYMRLFFQSLTGTSSQFQVFPCCYSPLQYTICYDDFVYLFALSSLPHWASNSMKVKVLPFSPYLQHNIMQIADV